MSNKITRKKLRSLRNDICIQYLIADVLKQPHKISEGYFRFLCPVCREFDTAVNKKTNLARCFRCQKNFNPIDMVIVEKNCSFLEAVDFLLPLL